MRRQAVHALEEPTVGTEGAKLKGHFCASRSLLARRHLVPEGCASPQALYSRVCTRSSFFGRVLMSSHVSSSRAVVPSVQDAITAGAGSRTS